MRKDLMKLTAVELGKKIKDKEVTVVEATKACLERIKALVSFLLHIQVQ